MVRGKLLFEPRAIDGLSILATVSYAENESGDPFIATADPDGQPVDPFDRVNFASVEGFENYDQTIANIEVNYAFSPVWSLTSTTSWNDGEYDRQDDADRGHQFGDMVRTRKEDNDIFTKELRLNFDTDRYRGNIGAYYFDSSRDAQVDDSLPFDLTETIVDAINNTPALNPLIPFADAIAGLYPNPTVFLRDGTNGTEIENWAIYSNLDFDASDVVSLHGGFRYDNEKVTQRADEERDLESTLPDPAALPPELADAAPGVAALNGFLLSTLEQTTLDTTTDYDAFLPYAGITLRWTDDFSTGFRIHRGYRAGGSGTSTSGNFVYDPEFTTNYELSLLRSRWLDNRLAVNANIFYVDWKDQQVLVTDRVDNTEFRTVNAGKSQLSGFELEVFANPTASLSLFANIGFVDTEFTDFRTKDAEGNIMENFTGSEFLNAPDTSAAAGFSYHVSRKLSVQADINYLADSLSNFDDLVTDDNEALRNDARTITNDKITYKHNKHIEFALIGKNIFDKDYISRNRRDVSRGSDNFVNVGDPRTVWLQVQGKF
jgi:outer membrane receptor protein involved in Fe transport